MQPVLNRLVLYARDPQKTTEFYETHFGFASKADDDGGIIELTSPHGGAILMVHRAAKSVKLGQVAVKLVFDIDDVEAFKCESASRGLEFGATHQAGGYSFANAKDPDGNSISISSRTFRKPS